MRKEQKANYPESARGAAALLVRMVLEDGAYTNIALNQYLRGSRLSDLDRRLATELVYGTVKASGTLDWYLAQCVSRPLDLPAAVYDAHSCVGGSKRGCEAGALREP